MYEDEKKIYSSRLSHTQLEPLGFIRFLTTIDFLRPSGFFCSLGSVPLFLYIYRYVSPRPHYQHLPLGKGDDSLCKPSLKLALIGVGPQTFEGRRTHYDVSFPDPYY
jgi:hypothetical protein